MKKATFFKFIKFIAVLCSLPITIAIVLTTEFVDKQPDVGI